MKLCQELNIKYNVVLVNRINKTTKKNNSYSQFRVLGKNVVILGDYLYNGETFGLVRKENKCKQIKESYGNKKVRF